MKCLSLSCLQATQDNVLYFDPFTFSDSGKTSSTLYTHFFCFVFLWARCILYNFLTYRAFLLLRITSTLHSLHYVLVSGCLGGFVMKRTVSFLSLELYLWVKLLWVMRNKGREDGKWLGFLAPIVVIDVLFSVKLAAMCFLFRSSPAQWIGLV